MGFIANFILIANKISVALGDQFVAPEICHSSVH